MLVNGFKIFELNKCYLLVNVSKTASQEGRVSRISKEDLRFEGGSKGRLQAVKKIAKELEPA